MGPAEAIGSTFSCLPQIQNTINDFAKEVLRSRGGRMGSGMGALLEALWGYFANKQLILLGLEMGRMEENQYNDFACLSLGATWDPTTRGGELFRVEVKSMNVGAEESKGHFDELIQNIGEHDQLLVLVWVWDKLENSSVYPKVLDQSFSSARGVANLRDALHVARGGSFVDRNQCPDKCEPEKCTHHGEPLNESEKRERKSGPQSCRVSSTTSYASNFGGLVRMLKTESGNARIQLRNLRRSNSTAHDYISFIHHNFPKEEENQYLLAEWKVIASRMVIPVDSSLTKQELIASIRKKRPDYQSLLRDLG